jgi:RNA polymerase sigma factor (TIGR02999 family)
VTTSAAPDVTALLLQWNQGTREARGRLIALVYRDLRKMAQRSLSFERPDHTLQPTALVHEAYERLIQQGRVDWRDRAHFFAIAARVMRRILVDRARRRRALRRGGGGRAEAIDGLTLRATPGLDVTLLDLEDALVELTRLDEDLARIVELRFYGGLSVEETAEVLARSRASVLRDWAMARAWLHRRLG